MKLIEVEIYQGNGAMALKKKVSINPEYIVFIESDEDHAFVHMSNKSILHTVESKDDILNTINGYSSNKYIG